MVVVFVIHYAKSLRAIRVTLTTVKAQLAKLALIYLAIGSSAIKTYVFVPIARLHAIIATIASLALCRSSATFLAGVALFANIKSVIKNALLTLLADKTALFAMLSIIIAHTVLTVARCAFGAMHTVKLHTSLTKAATVAKSAHAICTYPAFAAKGFLIVSCVALLASHTVRPLVQVAVFTQMTLNTELCH